MHRTRQPDVDAVTARFARIKKFKRFVYERQADFFNAFHDGQR